MKSRIMGPILVGLLIGGLTLTLYVLYRYLHGGVISPELGGYTNVQELVSDVRRLPVIRVPSETHIGQWNDYVSVTRRLQGSDPQLIKNALDQLSRERGPGMQNFKIMVLLRVCFECPRGSERPGLHGTWISYSALEAGHTNREANWPVEYKHYRFYLSDSLDAYYGRPYDPVGEFEWMAENCKWRDL